MTTQELFGERDDDGKLVFWDSTAIDEEGRVHIKLVYDPPVDSYELILTRLDNHTVISTKWIKRGNEMSPGMGIDVVDVDVANYFGAWLLKIIDPIEESEA